MPETLGPAPRWRLPANTKYQWHYPEKTSRAPARLAGGTEHLIAAAEARTRSSRAPRITSERVLPVSLRSRDARSVADVTLI